MFDRIAPTYDRVNRILSFRQDIDWRRKVSQAIPKTKDISVLDVATGTGDLLLALCEACPNIKEAVGVDLAENMLAFGQKKVRTSQFSHKITLAKADAASLPFSDAKFDAVTIGFGIRNVTEVSRALREFKRVLKPQGRLIVLEFSLPQNFFLRHAYLGYFRHILPAVGGIISKEKGAYSYLNRTVESFPYSTAFTAILKDSGFVEITEQPLTFGIATIYVAGV